MPHKSNCPDLDIPASNILDFVYAPNDPVPKDASIWHDSSDPSNYLSKAQSLHRLKQLAVALDNLGIQEQEVVMIFTPNHICVPVAYMGIVGSKRIFSGANPIYTVNEVVYQIENTGAKAVLVHPSLLDTAISAAQKAGLPKDRLFQFNDSPSPESQGVKDWFSILGSDSAAQSYNWPKLSPQQAKTTVATINYSSGTTGLPKGVMISHGNLIANVMQTVYMRDLEMSYNPQGRYLPPNRPQERWNAFLPLYHAYGQLFTCLIATLVGAKVYVMRKFDYSEFLKVIERYKVTHIQAAPPIIVMLARRPETTRYDLSSVKYIMSGAAPLSKELQNEVSDRFKLSITQGWGMTETTCAGMHVPGGARDDSGSVGLLDPNTEGKLLDDDGNEIVSCGVPGELYVRGPQMCLGYWRNEKATAETLSADGWLRTGDVAKVDEKGWFWIVDRKKELIKVNGLQVAPAELEALLLEHPAIADAAVVGITVHDEEFPRAYVVLQQASNGKVTPEEIQEWVRPRAARHKHLVGGVAFVEEVPKLASGKIVRKLMREWAKRAVPEMEGRIKARL